MYSSDIAVPSGFPKKDYCSKMIVIFNVLLRFAFPSNADIFPPHAKGLIF